jgi:hypothetical protein
LNTFEYISIPVSIVLAIGIGKILSAISHIFSKDSRDWVFILWCLSLLGGMLSHWVSVWSLRLNEHWTAAEFFLLMLSPLLYYAAAHVLISSAPERIQSWSAHLSSVARLLLSLFLLVMCNFLVRSFVILDDFSPPVSFSWLLAGIACLTSITIVFPKRWLLTASAVAWLMPVIFAAVFTEF